MYVRYEESCIPGCVRVPRASSLKSRSAELAQIISRPDPEIFSSLMIRVANSPPSILGSHGIVAFCLQIRASDCHALLPQIRGDPWQRPNGGRPGGTLALAGTPPRCGAWRRSLGRQAFSIEFLVIMHVRHRQPQPRQRSLREVSLRSNRPHTCNPRSSSARTAHDQPHFSPLDQVRLSILDFRVAERMEQEGQLFDVRPRAGRS